MTSLIGRQHELAALLQRLRGDRVRLLTLTGPAGVGKTRLALEAAQQLLQDLPDGAVFVDLVSIRDPELVLFGIAQALKIREFLDRSLLDRLRQHLSQKTMLLVMDNFEHVLPAAAAIGALIATCPHLKILATSRAPLHLSGEHEFPVAPLAHPDLVRMPAVELLLDFAAVALFVDRAQSARPDFALTPQNAHAVAEICLRLDGLPLALELAAVRIKVLPPEAIVERLQRRPELLTTGPVDLPPRQRTLSGAIGWSYDLLDSPEQTLFRRLAVFAGGSSLDAVNAVCNADGRFPNIVDGLASLIDKSLLIQERRSDGEARFAMLETIRGYARERLEASGEDGVMQRQHAGYFLALVERAETEFHGPEQGRWLARLEAGHDNLRAALHWSIDGGADVLIGLRLAAALSRFWEIRGYWSEGRRWLDAVLRNSAGGPPAAKVHALNGAGLLAFEQGDYARATMLAEESLSLGRALGDKRGTANALNILGLCACVKGDYTSAAALGAESLTLCREILDPVGIVDATHVLGLVAYDRGDHPQAAALLEESLQLSRELNARWRTAINLTDLGLVLRELGQHARAAGLMEESLDHFRVLGHKNGLSSALSNLATVAWRQRQFDRAMALFAESLVLRRELGELRGIAVCLVGLAAGACATRRFERAARLFGAADGLRESVGAALPRFIRGEYDRLVARTRRQLGDAFPRLWAEGRTMSTDQAAEYALASGTASEPAGRARRTLLTRREQEVAALIAQGETNREIAKALTITEKTAENHVQHILNKMGFRSRAQIAAWAAQHSLSPRP